MSTKNKILLTKPTLLQNEALQFFLVMRLLKVLSKYWEKVFEIAWHELIMSSQQ